MLRLTRTPRQASFATLGDQARDKGEWDVAVAFYSNALAHDLRNSPLWVQYGHALKESGRLQDAAKLAKAEAAYRRALIYAPRVADTYLQLGHVLKLQGRIDKAKAAYLWALALDPELSFARDELRTLGWEEDDGAELRAARTSLNGAVALGRRRPSLIERADAARDAGQWALAAQCYRTGLERDPGNGAIWVQYGHALKKSRRYAEAEAAYRQAVTEGPPATDPYIHLGHVLKLQGNLDQALTNYLHAIELDPALMSADRIRELRRLGWSEQQIDELRTLAARDLRKGEIEGFNTLHEDLAVVADKTQPHSETIRVYLDKPQLPNSSNKVPVRNRLVIEGWALARSGVRCIDFLVGGKLIANASYGLSRWDVASENADWPNAQHSGFTMIVAGSALPTGAHTAILRVQANNGDTKEIAFGINVANHAQALLRTKIPRKEIDYYNRLLDVYNRHPTFQLMMLVGQDTLNVAASLKTVKALRHQVYNFWHLTLVPKSSEATFIVNKIYDLCNEIENIKSRVSLWPRESEKFPDHFSLADTLIGVITPGDELSCDAFLKFATATGEYNGADFIYSDELRINPANNQIDSFLKPQWSPDLLLSTNYVGRIWFAPPHLIKKVGSTPTDLIEHGEYDFVLRLTEAANSIRHIPELLCLRGKERLDTAITERRAIERALKRRRIGAEIFRGSVAGSYRVRRNVPREKLVSVIILTRASRGLIRTCLETLRNITAYKNFEVICAENIPADHQDCKKWLKKNADKVLEMREPFNWARFNNIAAMEAWGEYLVFLNDDVEIIDPEWLDALIEHGQRPEVGVVGPLLLWPDRSIQSAGVFLTDDIGRQRHAFRNTADGDSGYFGLALTQRNVIAVNGACLLTRRDVFDRLGGFNEAHRVVNNETDYCFKALRAGLLNIYTPYSQLVHHERASRNEEGEDYDLKNFAAQWGSFFTDGDPYHHPLLSKQFDCFMPELEPLRMFFAGNPIIKCEQVNRILVLKLDHIGDCVTAFPAIEQLKGIFPSAKIHVLAQSVTRPLWSLTEEVDEVLEFDFFKVRSDQGINDLTEEDLEALGRRLAPYDFDLAVDLRRHPETRHILQYTGARLLAGYDLRGRFPWLDIALEWSGDAERIQKRDNAADELINLVDAIKNASKTPRRATKRIQLSRSPLSSALNSKIFKRPVVAMHPGAGNPMKQWPATFFAELADLLIEHDKVNVILVGGAQDRAIASEIRNNMRHPRHIFDLSSELTLAALPALLANCSLFVGNDSGPKHIAAHIGVPTIGIHSGQVDAQEWGPSGDLAIALQRDMECSPCYLPTADLCPRNLACLTTLRPGHVYHTCKNLLSIGVHEDSSVPR